MNDDSPPTDTGESGQLDLLDAPSVGTAPVREPDPDSDPLEGVHENIERQSQLLGTTYKIHPPVLEHALYITINNIVLNPGTEHEIRRPFEIFINSKNMDHFEWVVALTRIMSAVFRKGGNLDFLVEELRNVFSPRGGYFAKGGRWMHSVVAEIGTVIERHLVELGLMEPPKLDAHQRELIERARQKLAVGTQAPASEQVSRGTDPFAGRAQLCTKCNALAVLVLDGCLTCMECGDSKCG